MIARSHRFHGLNSLRLVYTRGRIVRGPLFAVKFLPGRRAVKPVADEAEGAQPQTPQSPVPYRAAVVVSRKVHKSATVRNRIRRRMYEQVRALEPGMRDPYDMIITVFDDRAARVPADELRSQLTNQLAKGGIIEVPDSTPEASFEAPDRGHQSINHGIVEGMERDK